MMLMPRIFDDDFFRDDFFRGKDKMHNQIMKTDIQEDDHAYTLDIDLPGYNKEDIKIDVTNGYLTISAKTNHEEKDEKSNYPNSIGTNVWWHLCTAGNQRQQHTTSSDEAGV